jgi:hypothetical protein
LNQIDPKIVATGIDSSYTSVENLGSFFALYLGQEEPIDDALVDELEQFAQVCEDDNASAWAWTTEILARLNIDAAWSFGDRLAPLFSTVEPQMVADILTTISYGKIDSLAESIAEDVDSERIENQLKSTDLPPEELAKVIAKLVWVSPRQFTQLAIDFNTLLLDVEPQDFPVVLCRVAWGNEESAREMLNSLSIGEITTYLDTINDDRYYYRALAAIYLVNPSIIQALKTELSQPDPEKLESSIYRRAAWTLVSEAIDVPVDGLQVGVEGPAHSHFDEQELAAYRQLKACATADDADARECLTGITDSYGPLACLRAVILIPPETMDSLGREQVRSWLTEELAAELPSHIVEVTSATLESPRNGQS